MNLDLQVTHLCVYLHPQNRPRGAPEVSGE